jgi:integrase/recombinase XerD
MGFSEFIRERQFLSNVSLSTLEWYKHSFKWLHTEFSSQDELKDAVLRMREKGLKATGCNSAIRAINTYVHWSNGGADVKCSPACKHPKIAQLKEPQLVLPTFTEQQIRLLVAWKPKGKYQQRLHLLTLLLLDSGCRISEALSLRVREIDFENLLVTLDGKGAQAASCALQFRVAETDVSLLQGIQPHA